MESIAIEIKPEAITIKHRRMKYGTLIRIEQDDDIVVIASPNGLRKLIETLIEIENTSRAV